MKHEKTNNLQKQLTTVSVAVSLLLTVGGVAIGLLNYYTLNQLQPISARISKVEGSQDKVADELLIYKATQATLIEKLATKDQMDTVIARLQNIEDKVEYLYQIHIK